MPERLATSISVDSRVKQEATAVFEELGLSFSTGIEIYLRAVARERRIPFDIDLNKDVRLKKRKARS